MSKLSINKLLGQVELHEQRVKLKQARSEQHKAFWAVEKWMRNRLPIQDLKTILLRTKETVKGTDVEHDFKRLAQRVVQSIPKQSMAQEIKSLCA